MTTTTVRRGPWACPDSALVLPADAPRPKWLEARREGIGGSDASTVAGVNRWGSRYELWLDKTGRAPEREETAAMRFGNLLEPIVADLFTEETGIPVRRAGLMRSRTRLWQQVSLDRLTGDGGLLECKTTNWRMADEWDDEQVADHAEVQTQHALDVTGRTHAWVAVLIDGRDFRFRRVERDEELIGTLREMENRFWHDYVLADTPPPMEANALDVVKDVFPVVLTDQHVAEDPERIRSLLAARKTLKEAVKDAETELKAIDAELIAAVGDAEALVIGDRPVVTRKTITARRLDLEALGEEHPELIEKYTRPSTYRRLWIPKTKEK